ncbi:GIY-YIG nuclease family protein [Streptomyces sp. NPDC006784]|uniref:GIY-YIG nuclease family protein n=1 Tax=Streptomyces sp. NPDC006784 TaxID=3364764 RepID=UPI003686DEF0
MPRRGEQIDFARPTALYRLFDRAGRLLYVGVAFDPAARWQSHARDKAWWDDVVERRIEWHPTRTEALTAEVQAIKHESPAYNVVDVDEPVLRHVVRKPGVPQPRLFLLSDDDWAAYKLACKDKGLSRAADIRMHIKREVAAYRRRQRDS